MHRRTRARLAALLAGLMVCAAQAAEVDALCADTARQPSRDPRVAALVASARAEHAGFGRQEIDSAGRLIRSGYGEAEFDRDADDTEPAWRKVQRYWQAWSADEPGQVRDSGSRWQRIALLRESVRSVSTARLSTFGGEGIGLGLSARETDALDTSLTRAALVDNPWSAVFISYLMRAAGFGPNEFRFSDAHADYARAGFATRRAEADAATGAGAYRACDLATTPPRPGDLVCNTRARAAFVDTFGALEQALRSGRSLPMHCEVVVQVDTAGLSMQAIGGNVLQSVTLRHLALQPQADAALPPLLSPAYRERAAAPDASFNDQPWVLLMQVR
ncbi:DUF2272 domain-containing protein [Xylophilus sp. GOD-11R]|uniref:DUF2272 domain-containing protein n=1 Tax=Xylophilus sp. GOD-11R TaxID=3089814 RepID=UPI00298CCEE8|nr:DUF2272 domain-containing protein [Xylophilus sp. GOD-11R]WPB56131.1 DUF2272 domain-containing protein [Xylophilus sp. GOD-11R]